MVALIGPFAPSLLGSELARLRGELARRAARPSTSRRSREALELVREAVRAGAVSQRPRRLRRRPRLLRRRVRALGAASGATLDLEPLMRRAEVDAATALFGEGPGGVVVSGPARRAAGAEPRAPPASGFLALGSVGGDGIRIAAGAARIDMSVEDAGSLFDSALGEQALVTSAATVREHGRRRATARRASRVPEPELADRDGPRDECGVFGVYAPEHDVARLAYFALYALQHRGQESAGIATCEERPHHDPARPRPRLPGVRRAQPPGAHRRDGDRPRALLDHRRAAAGRTRSPSTAHDRRAGRARRTTAT